MSDYTDPKVKFNVTKKEMNLITAITMRAFDQEWIASQTDYLSLNMDITAIHCNGNELDLERFLAADELNFFHDITGIMRHINRRTGKLKNYFMPRYSK